MQMQSRLRLPSLNYPASPGGGGGAPPFNGTQFYVDTDAAGGGNGSQGSPWNNWRASCTASVNTALATDAVRVNLAGATNDTLNVIQTHWDTFTNTTAARYIEFKGNWPGGAWDESKYVLEVTNGSVIYNNKPPFVRIDRVQIKLNSTDAGTYVAMRLSSANVGVGEANPECWFTNSIIWLNRTGTGRPTGIYHSEFNGGDIGLVKNENIVIFDKGTGGIGVDGVNNIVHCTHDSILSDCAYYDFGTGVFVNCVSVNGAGAGGIIDERAGSQYCCSADASASGTGSKINQNYASSFTDRTNGNFIPLVGDTVLRNAGNTALTTDCRGLPRPAGGQDDMGPFEYQ
jgi:hypothetical protein